MSDTRRIKFLSRDLPFPTDPTYREYRVVQELAGVSANELLLGTAGAFAYPALAMIALMRANKNVTHEQLNAIMDLSIGDIEIDGKRDEDEDVPPAEAGEQPADRPTGTKSTDETREESGTPDSDTTSPEPPESPTT